MHALHGLGRRTTRMHRDTMGADELTRIVDETGGHFRASDIDSQYQQSTSAMTFPRGQNRRSPLDKQ